MGTLLSPILWTSLVYGEPGADKTAEEIKQSEADVATKQAAEPQKQVDGKAVTNEPNAKDAKLPDADPSASEKSDKPEKAPKNANPTKSGADKKADAKSADKPSGTKGAGNKGAGKKPVEKQTAENTVEKFKVKNAAKSLLKGDVTSDQETQALEFASRHHPELVALISPLKTSNPKEYQRAVRELFRSSERLNNIQLRDPARFDLELEAWKLHSNVRLLAARLVMEPEPELQEDLKAAIRKKADNRLRIMQFEKESLLSRLEQVNSNIEKSTKSRDQVVDQEYERLLKQASRDKPVVAKKKKNKNS
jgi:hypothetical protein